MKKRGFVLGADGWLAGAKRHPSAHFNARPAGTRVSLIVVHFISLPAGSFAGEDVDRLFTGKLDPGSRPDYESLRGLRVSSHFVIRRTGEVRQYVSTRERAWHAGVSSFMGRENCNDFSVGIELEGTQSVPFTEAQYRSLFRVCRALCRALPIEHVTGHEFVAPGRKIDPGPFFDWKRLARALPRGVDAVTAAASRRP
ncbi:MAG: N-acetylmuramoyl-L-alanine amidase domain-containing protein [Burkholderia sp.]|jgi:N-acetyl-anhydromuramoyl-L-alanine amidase